MKSTVYVHDQGTPSNVWTIDHNLNGTVACDVIVQSGGQLVTLLPLAVKRITANRLQIDFTTPQVGTARLVGPYSLPALKSPGTVDLGQGA